jgi:hypothetical protein
VSYCWHWFRYLIEDGDEQRERLRALQDAVELQGCEFRAERGPGYITGHVWCPPDIALRVNVAVRLLTDEAPTDDCPPLEPN